MSTSVQDKQLKIQIGLDQPEKQRKKQYLSGRHQSLQVEHSHSNVNRKVRPVEQRELAQKQQLQFQVDSEVQRGKGGSPRNQSSVVLSQNQQKLAQVQDYSDIKESPSRPFLRQVLCDSWAAEGQVTTMSEENPQGDTSMAASTRDLAGGEQDSSLQLVHLQQHMTTLDSFQTAPGRSLAPKSLRTKQAINANLLANKTFSQNMRQDAVYLPSAAFEDYQAFMRKTKNASGGKSLPFSSGKRKKKTAADLHDKHHILNLAMKKASVIRHERNTTDKFKTAAGRTVSNAFSTRAAGTQSFQSVNEKSVLNTTHQNAIDKNNDFFQNQQFNQTSTPGEQYGLEQHSLLTLPAPTTQGSNAEENSPSEHPQSPLQKVKRKPTKQLQIRTDVQAQVLTVLPSIGSTHGKPQVHGQAVSGVSTRRASRQKGLPLQTNQRAEVRAANAPNKIVVNTGQAGVDTRLPISKQTVQSRLTEIAACSMKAYNAKVSSLHPRSVNESFARANKGSALSKLNQHSQSTIKLPPALHQQMSPFYRSEKPDVSVDSKLLVNERSQQQEMKAQEDFYFSRTGQKRQQQMSSAYIGLVNVNATTTQSKSFVERQQSSVAHSKKQLERQTIQTMRREDQLEGQTSVKRILLHTDNSHSQQLLLVAPHARQRDRKSHDSGSAKDRNQFKAKVITFNSSHQSLATLGSLKASQTSLNAIRQHQPSQSTAKKSVQQIGEIARRLGVTYESKVQQIPASKLTVNLDEAIPTYQIAPSTTLDKTEPLIAKYDFKLGYNDSTVENTTQGGELLTQDVQIFDSNDANCVGSRLSVLSSVKHKTAQASSTQKRRRLTQEKNPYLQTLVRPQVLDQPPPELTNSAPKVVHQKSISPVSKQLPKLYETHETKNKPGALSKTAQVTNLEASIMNRVDPQKVKSIRLSKFKAQRAFDRRMSKPRSSIHSQRSSIGRENDKSLTLKATSPVVRTSKAGSVMKWADQGQNTRRDSRLSEQLALDNDLKKSSMQVAKINQQQPQVSIVENGEAPEPATKKRTTQVLSQKLSTALKTAQPSKESQQQARKKPTCSKQSHSLTRSPQQKMPEFGRPEGNSSPRRQTLQPKSTNERKIVPGKASPSRSSNQTPASPPASSFSKAKPGQVNKTQPLVQVAEKVKASDQSLAERVKKQVRAEDTPTQEPIDIKIETSNMKRQLKLTHGVNEDGGRKQKQEQAAEIETGLDGRKQKVAAEGDQQIVLGPTEIVSQASEPMGNRQIPELKRQSSTLDETSIVKTTAVHDQKQKDGTRELEVANSLAEHHDNQSISIAVEDETIVNQNHEAQKPKIPDYQEEVEAYKDWPVLEPPPGLPEEPVAEPLSSDMQEEAGNIHAALTRPEFSSQDAIAMQAQQSAVEADDARSESEEQAETDRLEQKQAEKELKVGLEQLEKYDKACTDQVDKSRQSSKSQVREQEQRPSAGDFVEEQSKCKDQEDSISNDIQKDDVNQAAASAKAPAPAMIVEQEASEETDQSVKNALFLDRAPVRINAKKRLQEAMQEARPYHDLLSFENDLPPGDKADSSSRGATRLGGQGLAQESRNGEAADEGLAVRTHTMTWQEYQLKTQGEKRDSAEQPPKKTGWAGLLKKTSPKSKSFTLAKLRGNGSPRGELDASQQLGSFDCQDESPRSFIKKLVIRVDGLRE